MDVTINNRFGVLLAEKRAENKRNIPMAEVSRETGIPAKTLQAWANNRVTRYDARVIDALCKYFQVSSVADLIEYVED